MGRPRKIGVAFNDHARIVAHWTRLRRAVCSRWPVMRPRSSGRAASAATARMQFRRPDRTHLEEQIVGAKTWMLAMTTSMNISHYIVFAPVLAKAIEIPEPVGFDVYQSGPDAAGFWSYAAGRSLARDRIQQYRREPPLSGHSPCFTGLPVASISNSPILQTAALPAPFERCIFARAAGFYPTDLAAAMALSLSRNWSVEPQTVAQYTYDAFGQRVAKSQPATSTTTLYQFDQLGSLLEESNTQGNPAPSDYIYLDDGRPVATLTPVAGNLYFLHDDRFGTPQLATDSSQAVAWNMNYQPFGQTGNVQDSLVQPQNLRLPGQQADAESGIYHNGFRDYVPNLGRYIESDPIGIAGGINTYAYAGANPLANTAPQGLSTFRAFLYTMDKQGDDTPRRQACGTLSGIFGHDGGPHDERFYRHGGTPSRP
jgi:RHS repeat-associated protein